MTKVNTTQEILMLTASSFAQKELCENDFSADKASKALSQSEKLEEACWNGLLEDWLRGIITKSRDQKLSIWQIQVADIFLCVQMSPAPSNPDRYHSVNPYLFLALKNFN